MLKLLKQSKLTTELDKVRKDMTNRNSGDIYLEQFGDEFFGEHVETRRVVSEDASHFILIKGLSQKKQKEHIQHLEDNQRLILSPETSDVTETTSDELMLDSEAERVLFKKKETEMQQTVNLITDSPVSLSSSLEGIGKCSPDRMSVIMEDDVCDNRNRSNNKLENGSDLLTIESGEPGNTTTEIGTEKKLTETQLKHSEKPNSSSQNSTNTNTNSQLLLTEKNMCLKRRDQSVEYDLKHVKRQKNEKLIPEKNTIIADMQKSTPIIEIGLENEETVRVLDKLSTIITSSGEKAIIKVDNGNDKPVGKESVTDTDTHLLDTSSDSGKYIFRFKIS